ncbi:proton-conducting transporter membrane subunit [Desulfurella sp.]|uniref:proton-conducting transporter transmembrane domain-containing protein n=1 Tax=Desulfurella sp. TaxID=1962857 RepID=UPI003D14018C
MIYTLPALFATIGSILCFIGFRKKERTVSVFTSLLSLISSIFILFSKNYSSSYFYVDNLSKIFSLMIAIVYFGVVIFSIEYISNIKERFIKVYQYFMLLNIFVAAMFFSVILNNLGLIWVGIEATTFSSALLVAVENDFTALEAAWRYIIIVSVGLVISLIATLFLYSACDTLSIFKLLTIKPTGSLFLLGAILLIIGYGTKAGIFPMNTWLADAHGKSPAPVSAIFSAVLLPVSLYPIIRLFQINHNILLSEFAFILGFLSVATASIMSLNQTLYKRLFAYSSIENMGLALIGISLGSYALFGAIVLIFAHAFAKSGIFMLTGNILHNYKSKKIEDINGIIKTMPHTGLFLFFGSLAVTGAPPSAIFFGEFLILSKTIDLYGWLIGSILISFVGCGFLFINYKVINMVFSGQRKKAIKESNFTLVPIINITLSILTLISLPFLYRFLQGVIK